jgi:hypothetical protein
MITGISLAQRWRSLRVIKFYLLATVLHWALNIIYNCNDLPFVVFFDRVGYTIIHRQIL